MPVLQSSQVIYSFSTDELKKLIAADMKLPEAAITVRYVLVTRSDPFDWGGNSSSDYSVGKVEVTVDQTKIPSP